MVLALAVLLVSVTAGAQSAPIALSIDHVLTHPLAGDSRHEILPVAVFDGTSFRPVRDWDPVLGESSRSPYLLSRYPIAQVLHHGERVGSVTISDVYRQGFQCNALIVGTGEYESNATLPASEISGISRRRENGEQIEYTTETFLTISRAFDESDLQGGPVITAVTAPAELERYAVDVERVAPRPELVPLGVNETRAYRVNGQNSVLVVRNRQAAGTIDGPGNSQIAPTFYSDYVIVRTDAGGLRSVLPLLRTQLNGLGGGTTSYFIDAFTLADGTVYFAFKLYLKEAVSIRLYRLGAGVATDSRLVFDTVLHGC